MITKPEVILFDADGVMQGTDMKWWFAMSGLVGDADDDRVAQFFADLIATERPALVGATPFAPLLADLLVRWDVLVPVEEVMGMWHHIDVDPEMISAVGELTAEGVRCALATNQHAERAAYMQRELGYDQVFSELFYSCEVGLAKPDPDYFRHALDRMRAYPDRVLLLDDNPQNVRGAEEAGLRAELFAQDGGRAELTRILSRHGWA